MITGCRQAFCSAAVATAMAPMLQPVVRAVFVLLQRRERPVYRPSPPCGSAAERTHCLSLPSSCAIRGCRVEACCAWLQAQVPHTIYTVVKTASHLQPFPFNQLPASARGMARARGESTAGSTTDAVADGSDSAVLCAPTPGPSGPVQVLCRVCDAPLSERDIAGGAIPCSGAGAASACS
jgi:hypothetical protein